MTDLSIVIPAFNEERRIRATLERIIAGCAKRSESCEVIVVDDGSTDRTAAIVEEVAARCNSVRLLRHDVNRGKGAAVRTGVLDASGRLILFTDADLSTPLTELDKLLTAIRNGYDVAIGSRGLPDSRIVTPQPLPRRLIGRVFPILVRCIVTRRFHDTQCGFKLFTREAARTLFAPLRTPGFAFDVEILYRAIRQGMRVAEVPVVWVNSPYSSVRIVRHSFSMLAALFAIRCRRQ